MTENHIPDSSTQKIIAFPHRPGAGGPGSFQRKFEKQLQRNNWKICYAGEHTNPDVVFIVGGTKRILWLLRMKWRKVPIVYRLDGIKWLHKKINVGWKQFMLISFSNLIMKYLHAYVADTIVYQSNFVKNWWDKEGFKKKNNTHIIYNGVEIPSKNGFYEVYRSTKLKRLIVMEGVVDYTPYAVRLLNDLANLLPLDVQLEIYGNFENKKNSKILHERVKYQGFIANEQVVEILTGGVYLSLDIHPACPNTVLEAMACGAPVVGFDTGSLTELVDDKCGRIVPYGGDSWQLAYPNVELLTKAIHQVFENYHEFSKSASLRAKKCFGIEEMTLQYENIINLLVHEKISS